MECDHLTTKTDQDLKNILELPMTTVSKNEKTTIRHIKVSNSYVPIIYEGSFNKFATIIELYLNASSVEEIQPGAFNNLHRLEKIRVDQNNITEITRGVFNHLTNLTTLDISHNYIKTIEKNSFLGLNKLQILLLNHNKLKFISSDDFSKLKSLNFINLSNNELSNVTKMLDNNSSISKNNFSIDLSFNFLKTLNFSDLPLNISKLSLNNNQIEEISGTMMPDLIEILLNSNHIVQPPSISNSLIHLNLSYNKIKELVLGFFHSKNLRRLDLSNNLLENLHRDVFDNLTNLELLNLQNNNIGYIPVGVFQALSTLKYLNMSGNKLFEFEYGTFNGLKSVTSLDISNNSLTSIVESTFHPLSHLTELFVSHNLLTTIDSSDFMQHLKTLKKVHLNNNPWICKSLLSVITKFGQKQIIVERGVHIKSTNVNGIACYNYKDLKQQLEWTTPSFSNLTATDYKWDQFNNFFNEGFFNTTFYNFFKNNMNLDFESKLTNIFQKQTDDTLNYTIFQLLSGLREIEENKFLNYLHLISTSQPHFEKLSDNFEERLINKMSNTLTNIFILFVVIVIILIFLLVVVTIKNSYNLFNCVSIKNSFDPVDIGSNANIELI
ncbi:hypothetical protein RN001_006666 [Aquatica leii]|uniref:Chaoptin n=1 Tax=Aquatica leii TaxID=1421715 RepID=A0AAN7PDU5_9COLE|nr:hypothetical protein RN001_006666 [Aquatica leii]